MTDLHTPEATSFVAAAAATPAFTDDPGPCHVSDDARDAADDMWAALDRVLEHSDGQIVAIKAVRESCSVPLLAARDLVRARWGEMQRRKFERIDPDDLTDDQIARILAIATEDA